MFVKKILPISMILAGSILVSCQGNRYETIKSGRIIGAWGVTNETNAFGEYDSLYYIISPVRNISDSIYFNGNYTDSYYESDSTRVTMRYTTSDSIEFCIDRRYTVEVNPKYLVLYAKAERDTNKNECTLLLQKDANNGNIFRCGPDKDLTKLLAMETLLHFQGTNASSNGEPQGGQNYEFTLDSHGFKKAIALADSLNDRYHGARHQKVHSAIHHNILNEIFKHPSNHKELPTKKH